MERNITFAEISRKRERELREDLGGYGGGKVKDVQKKCR